MENENLAQTEVESENLAIEGFESLIPDETGSPADGQDKVEGETKVEEDDLELATDDPSKTVTEQIDLDGEKFDKAALKAIVAEHKKIQVEKTNYEAKIREADETIANTKKERDFYTAELGFEAAKIQESLKEYDKVDWVRLLNENPQLYQEARLKYDLQKTNLQKVLDKREQFFGYIEEQLEVENQKKAFAAVNELKKTFKNWNAENYKALIEYGVTKGYSKDFLKQTTDPQIFKMLHSQRAFEKASGTFKPVPKNNVTNINQVRSRGNAQKTGAMDRLRATGDKNDAIAVFESLLG
jgi:hypothetical protein